MQNRSVIVAAGGDSMKKGEALIYYVCYQGDQEKEDYCIKQMPLNGAYLQEWIQQLQEETNCQRIVIRNIIYLE